MDTQVNHGGHGGHGDKAALRKKMMERVVSMGETAAQKVMPQIETFAKDAGLLLVPDTMALIETFIAHTAHMTSLCLLQVSKLSDLVEMQAGLEGVTGDELADLHSDRIVERLKREGMGAQMKRAGLI